MERLLEVAKRLTVFKLKPAWKSCCSWMCQLPPWERI